MNGVLNNPNSPPTKKQLDFIKVIQNTCGTAKFTGKTKAEACKYIDDHIGIFNEHCIYQELVFWGEV